MITLPAAFKERMSRELGDEAQAFFASYASPAAKGVRVNTLKISREDFIKISPFALEPVPWEPDGFYVQAERPGKTVLHAAGVYYVQEPSAMCAAPLLQAAPGERVLDLCSAPGGKGTQLAQAMEGKGVVWLNEINFSRAKVLSSNVERLGIKNAVVTCASPAQLAENFVGYFDKILVDAPCSGEGMFRKDAVALSEWSPQNVDMCVRRQAQILDCAARMLAPGGRMVYSTCTFSRAENEEQISSFLNRHINFSLVSQHRLWPHKVRGEGHYAALLVKGEGDSEPVAELRPHADRSAIALYRTFEQSHLAVSFGSICSVGDRLYSLPEGCADRPVQTLRAGVCLGGCVKGRFEPAHSLAMCLREGQAPFVPVDERTALIYLSGGTFECRSGISGWAVASYMGFPLGWCKVTGGVAKNHLPKALRITN